MAMEHQTPPKDACEEIGDNEVKEIVRLTEAIDPNDPQFVQFLERVVWMFEPKSRMPFCCLRVIPYRNQRLEHESKFSEFMTWALSPEICVPENYPAVPDLLDANNAYAVQFVKQVNQGPIESKRYFTLYKDASAHERFVEISEASLIEANYKKINTYKNFKCTQHNKFFGVNIYVKDPVNKHHRCLNLAGPGSEIDL